jgi:hypothetical protein
MPELLLTPQRHRVRSCEVVADGAALAFGDRRVWIEARPDERRAARACGLATRILQVEFTVLDDARPRANVTAVWHRVPHTRSLPVDAALALTLSGVPSYVFTEATS